jgi:hypothetical protein
VPSGLPEMTEAYHSALARGHEVLARAEDVIGDLFDDPAGRPA